MEFIDELFILLIVLQGVYNLYQRVTGGNAAEKAEQMPPPEEDDGTWLVMLARARERIGVARARLAEQQARAARVAEGMSGGAVAPLRRAIEQRLIPELDRIDDELSELAGLLKLSETDGAADGPGAAEHAAQLMSEWTARSENMRDLLGRSARAAANLGALEGAARWRSDPRLGEIMADIDAVAGSMLAPMAHGASSGWFDWPPEPPLTLPTVGEPAALRALLADHPVVFVEPDVADEQTRWPAVIEAVARTVLQTRPQLFWGVAEAHHPGVPAWLPRQQGRRVAFDVQAAAGAWFGEIAVDAVAALLMGPVALSVLVDRLADPDDPYAVVRASAGRDHRTLDDTPPAHLRIRLMARTLGLMGYDAEARVIERRWDELHGEPDGLSLPSLFGSAVILPVQRAVEALEPWLVDFVTERHAALGDRAFGALSHFELSPGLWARTRQRAGQIASGQGFTESPRLIVAAALLAASERGGFTARLDRAVHRLITSPNERPAPDPHYRPRQVHLGDPLTVGDLVEAITLRAALHRPHGGQRARRRL